MVRAAGISAVLAAGLMAGTAMAADLYIPALPPILQPAAMAWTGFHVGVHAGVGMGNLGYTQEQPDPDPALYYEYATEFALAGLQFGYDYQFADRWVIGAEVEASKLNAEYVVNEGNPPLFWADWQASLTARLGYLPTPDTMLYVRGGVAALGTRAEDFFAGIESATVVATRIGVGAETFLTEQISARLEANYFIPSEGFTLANDIETFDPRMLTVTAGMNYSFGNETAPFPQTPDAAINWDGFYAGINGAFNAGLMIRDFDVALADNGPFGSDGFGVGAFLGYNFMLNEYSLLGLEVEADWQSHDFYDPQGAFGPTFPTLFATLGESAAVSARAGFFTNPSTLVYARGGFGVVRTTVNEDFYGLDGETFSELLPMVQIGAGIEAAIADNTTLRVEGVYTRALEGLTVNNAQDEQIAAHTPHMLTGRVGLAWHF